MKQPSYSLHVIHQKTGAMLLRPLTNFVPRVGDEFRLSGERYYKVIAVIWVMDEQEHPYQRVNVGVTDIEEPKP